MTNTTDLVIDLPISSANALTKPEKMTSLRAALTDRVSREEAVKIVACIIACYPKKEATGKGYIGALSAILMHYPRQIAERAANPISGLPSEAKYLPAPADLIAWCERQLAELKRPFDFAQHWADLGKVAQDRAESQAEWQKARATRLTLDELRVKHGANWGLGNKPDPLDRRAPKISWDKQVLPWKDIKPSAELVAIVHGQAGQPVDNLGVAGDISVKTGQKGQDLGDLDLPER